MNNFKPDYDYNSEASLRVAEGYAWSYKFYREIKGYFSDIRISIIESWCKRNTTKDSRYEFMLSEDKLTGWVECTQVQREVYTNPDDYDYEDFQAD
jgi:hypothetical protein